MPILVGLDGQRKMSKSFGNYVGITESPSEMFGKLMSIPDDLMWSYWDLVTDRPSKEIADLRNQVSSGSKHPMDVKMELAREVIAGFHGQAAAKKAADEFQRVFRDRQAPEEAPIFKVPAGPPRRITSLLVEAGTISSRSEAERLVKQGGVELVGDKTPMSVQKSLALVRGESHLIRVGKKKFLRIVVE